MSELGTIASASSGAANRRFEFEQVAINNVETLANIPHIIHHGADWFASIGTAALLKFAFLHFSYGLGFLRGLVKFRKRWGDRSVAAW